MAFNGLDSLSPLFYDGQQQMLSASSGSSQVLTITSFSLTPYGSRRMVQYTVAQSSAGAMNREHNLDANDDPRGQSGLQSSNSRSFQVNGNDRSGAYAGALRPTPQPATTAVGLTDDPSTIVNAITLLRRQNYYQVSGVPSPSVAMFTRTSLPARQSVEA